MKQHKKAIPGFISKKIDKTINKALKTKTQEEIDKEVKESLKKYPKSIPASRRFPRGKTSGRPLCVFSEDRRGPWF